MLRVFLLILLLCSTALGQGVTVGLHGCGSWAKAEIDNVESEDYELFYGGGADLTFAPPMSMFGAEAGFTFLMHKETTEEFGEEYETTIYAHPLWASGKIYLNPMFYLAGGVNYTFWKIEVDDVKLEDITGKMGFQAGAGVEFGAGGSRLYASGYYMIQKGKVEPDGMGSYDLETKAFQVRVGIRFGG